MIDEIALNWYRNVMRLAAQESNRSEAAQELHYVAREMWRVLQSHLQPDRDRLLRMAASILAGQDLTTLALNPDGLAKIAVEAARAIIIEVDRVPAGEEKP